MRLAWRRRNWILIILAASLSRALGSTFQLKNVQAFLPYCAYLSAGLQPHAATSLRSQVQMILYLQQRVRDLTELLHNNENPPKEIDHQLAYKTSKSIPELKADLDSVNKALSEHLRNNSAYIVQLMASKHLPQNATFDYVSHCVSSRLEPSLFPYRPKVSFLLQYFKRPNMISSFVTKLRGFVDKYGTPAELVVNVDNVDESEQWASLSYSTQGFVVPVLSDNVHEARAYNRIAAIARGQLLVFLQDDLHLPEDPVWVHRLLRLLDHYPQLGAVGMMSYRLCIRTHPNSYQTSIYFHDPELDFKAQFVGVADFAPLAVRQAAFEDVGGLDEGLSEKGVCGIYGDWELVTRMWLSGWQVMYMELDGQQPDTTTASGTHKPETGERCWGRQMRNAATAFNDRFNDVVMTGICDHVKRLNLELLKPSEDPAMPCPYESCSSTSRLL